jgi:hypothetical protein
VLISQLALANAKSPNLAFGWESSHSTVVLLFGSDMPAHCVVAEPTPHRSTVEIPYVGAQSERWVELQGLSELSAGGSVISSTEHPSRAMQSVLHTIA